MKAPLIAVVLGFFLCLARGATAADPSDATDDLDSLVVQASQASKRVEATDAEIADIRARHHKLALEVDAHNHHPCHWPKDEPESQACLDYDRQKEELMARDKLLQLEFRHAQGRRLAALAAFQDALARIRVAQFARKVRTGLEPWVERVKGCAALPSPEAASACLQTEWDRHP